MNLNKLRKTFSYNINTGILTKIRKTNRAITTDIAGFITADGYLNVGFNKKKYMVHRIIWILVHGVKLSDKDEIDHINHNRTDNRLVNLRLVNRQTNQKNVSKRKDNTSGITGVCWKPKQHKWHSQIGVNGKIIHLGFFVEFHEAVNARKNAEVLYVFHENHGKPKKKASSTSSK